MHTCLLNTFLGLKYSRGRFITPTPPKDEPVPSPQEINYGIIHSPCWNTWYSCNSETVSHLDSNLSDTPDTPDTPDTLATLATLDILWERFVTQINRTVLSLNRNRVYFSSSSKISFLLVLAHCNWACFGIHWRAFWELGNALYSLLNANKETLKVKQIIISSEKRPWNAANDRA